MKKIFLKLHIFIPAFICAYLSISAADLPRIGYVFPAGGQQGTSFEVKAGGENIYGAVSANVSGSGVVVEVVDSKDPRDEKDKDKKKQKRKNQTVIDEVVKLKIAVSPDAESGNREIRIITPAGVSNKLVFQVGQLKEINETEPNDRKDKSVQLPQIPILVNGQIMPGDTDNFKFSAKKGQVLVIETAARTLIPYLADAVPGWFQATLTLSNAQGKEVAFVDDYKFNPDPVMFYDVPADGDYILEIRDSIYRGRADFVYRIKIGELPFITHIFPLGASKGKAPVSVKIFGKNLSENSIDVDVNKDALSVQFVFTKKDELVSNRVPFAISNLPEIFESESNNQQEKAQKIIPPVIVNGRIQSPGEKDFFRFEGKKDQDISIEVCARRLGSPLDSGIILYDGHGKKLMENDDLKDKGEGIITHQADSGLIYKLPENGIYIVEISDTQGKGGEAYAYRLRISPPIPDFELRAVPANINIPQGGTSAFTIHALRKDGFKGEIQVAIKDDSSGLSLKGAVIPEGTDKMCMTISAPEQTSPGMITPKLEGKAFIDGKAICHSVIPAEDLMQAFIYQHLVPSVEQMVVITEPAAPFGVSVKFPDNKNYLELPLGKEINFNVAVTRKPGFEGPMQLQLVDPPKGITIRKGNIPPGKDTAVVILRTESKTEANLKGNLIFNGIMVVEKEEKETDAENDKTKEKSGQEKLKNKINAENKDIKENAGNNKDIQNVKDNKDAKELKEKKVKKERVIIMIPAVPFKIVNPPEKKKANENKNSKN